MSSAMPFGAHMREREYPTIIKADPPKHIVPYGSHLRIVQNIIPFEEFELVKLLQCIPPAQGCQWLDRTAVRTSYRTACSKGLKPNA